MLKKVDLSSFQEKIKREMEKKMNENKEDIKKTNDFHGKTSLGEAS